MAQVESKLHGRCLQYFRGIAECVVAASCIFAVTLFVAYIEGIRRAHSLFRPENKAQWYGINWYQPHPNWNTTFIQRPSPSSPVLTSDTWVQIAGISQAPSMNNLY
ncbi:hypothetical protein F4814DRAFT_450616 [Daldinia grandis]|nr:hypothetical protein F4814DRAFT_450616 [Daldinia grandis]